MTFRERLLSAIFGFIILVGGLFVIKTGWLVATQGYTSGGIVMFLGVIIVILGAGLLWIYLTPMRWHPLLVFVIVMGSLLAGCEEQSRHLPMLNVGNGEYLLCSPDPEVNDPGSLHYGYSLKSTKDGRVVQTFRYKPEEIRLEDFNGDGVKDLVFIILDPEVKGAGLHYGYSLKVALGKGNGTFGPVNVAKTFKYIE